ncbi:hypothetical protein F9B85_13805 [Heliorestis acidaminivorans]|uniref:Uncharacterized protein n=1 Tax=Heliorestis acidaminivorans TaxID=553427 RepID=A0A6I0EYZ2_9FIRM|nr:hypothetical protein [Heliorestis acidaminivorans]KAB2950898.1 hypothetical protein F9B85_13805 [Heliorestis acidaminivorans]
MKKKILAVLLIAIFTLVAIPLEYSYSQSKPIEYETHYFLDTGVVFVWKHSDGRWQNNLKPNDTYKSSYTLNMGALPHGKINKEDIEVVKVEPYSPSKHSFDTENFRRWSSPKAKDQFEYDENFYRHASNNINVANKNYDNKTGNLTVNFKAKLTPREALYDVKKTLEYIGPQEVYAYMGGERNVSQEIKNAIEMLKPSNFAANVEGYMYFVPTVVEYRVPKEKEIEYSDNYEFSAFHRYSMTHKKNPNDDRKKYEFWMFRPIDAEPTLSDEFLVEASSWTHEKGLKEFPAKYYKLDKDNPFLLYDFHADYNPLIAVIYRKGIENEKYKDDEVFKKQFFNGYEKEHQGEKYYLYDWWIRQADGEMMPTKYLFEHFSDDVVQRFLNYFGYDDPEEWTYNIRN